PPPPPTPYTLSLHDALPILLHRALHVRSQPWVRRELPRVSHLVKDQPAPEILIGQLGHPLPLFDIGLDEIEPFPADGLGAEQLGDRKSTRLNSSHRTISYAV